MTHIRSKGGRVTAITASTGVFAAAMIGVLGVVLQSREPAHWERTLARAAYDLPSTVTPILQVAMQAGTRGAIIAVGGVLLAMRRWVPAAGVLFAGFGTWGLVEITKVVVDRARPEISLLGRIPRELIDGGGFPSSHAGIAAALAAALVLMLEGQTITKWVGAILALLTAVARVHLGVHWPLDVLGGAAAGTFFATLTTALLGGLRPVSPNNPPQAEQRRG